MEIGNEGKISFLDTLIIVNEDSLIFDAYRKATFSGRFLNFHSHHPLCHKRGVIYGIIDKIILLCHPKFHNRNLIDAINIFLLNGYPLDFIFTTIKNRLKFHINKISSNNNNNNSLKKFFAIPFVDSVSNKFKPIANIFTCKLAYTIPNTLRNFIKRGKDKLEYTHNQNVVYKISCDNCDVSYVGQTKRQLKTRIHEHSSDINKTSKSPSVISNHRIETNHDFNWSNVKILDMEPSYNKRLISEMVHIKKQTHGINKQNDTESLPDCYTNMIHSLSTS
ncbi:hypothetical protein ALC62_03912 [Cyphomyrmex costatus]|uniref:GIY-YIG domain-containing protein n=1 Tax=Cyphomyrmex costatus TaxID=456900 RepID=A0A151IKR6_9HYME|nr:hypothetical protein ALC62_13319 [Cyphomyrmex costatus]KYN05194.1 hypothetical protein ALC62_03912 [Cyphomyrmex costatus]